MKLLSNAVTVGATRAPASAPRAAASPHPASSTRLTRIPTSAAFCWLVATARMASPVFVWFISSRRAPATATSTAERAEPWPR